MTGGGWWLVTGGAVAAALVLAVWFAGRRRYPLAVPARPPLRIVQ